ncbi:MAG: hypothetical protein NTZ67_00430 [Gammaproteobacteria bacterium]|nr:hypothetical protein [Gammaproteobacteria bacterium]
MRRLYRKYLEQTLPMLTSEKWINYHPDCKLTFQGKPFDLNAIEQQISLSGSVRIRGGSMLESPCITGFRGHVSRGDITSHDCVLEHTQSTVGISTTHVSSVATLFSEESKNGVIHAFDSTLIMDEHKAFVPYLIGGDDSLNKEQETVFKISIPEEVYLGFGPGLLGFGKFYTNSNYVDPVMLSNNSELNTQFYNQIYHPFWRDFAPKIRERKITEFELSNYENGRKEFHCRYRLFTQEYCRHAEKQPQVCAQVEKYRAQRG